MEPSRTHVYVSVTHDHVTVRLLQQLVVVLKVAVHRFHCSGVLVDNLDYTSHRVIGS